MGTFRLDCEAVQMGLVEPRRWERKSPDGDNPRKAVLGRIRFQGRVSAIKSLNSPAPSHLFSWRAHESFHST